MAYQRRLVDDLLDQLLPELSAIALEGAKGVGKTATASERAASIVSLDDPRQREILEADLDRVTQLQTPVLIDEWQLHPAVWDRVRRAVDDDPTGGRFLLAGSAGVDATARLHSGAGRIVRLMMRPLAFSERKLVPPTVSLAELLAGGRPAISGKSPIRIDTYVDEILRSGFPGIRSLTPAARERQLDSYIDRIVEHELPENGMSVRRPEALRAWLSAYGAATATTTDYVKILNAATPGVGDKPARPTANSYREHLARVFVLDPIPAWVPAFNPLKRLTQSPKHHLVDPALAARLVGIDASGLLRGDGERVATHSGTWLGALFESLAALSVRTYADAVSARVGHLRTKESSREIDLIVEGSDHQVVAIEVKLSETVDEHDVRHLNWLEREIGDRLADRVVLTTGEFAYRRADGVAVVPLALLGP